MLEFCFAVYPIPISLCWKEIGCDETGKVYARHY